MEAQEPKPGIYQNYKGAFHEVLGVAEEPLSGQRYVVYRALGLVENRGGDPDPNGPKLGQRTVATNTAGALAVSTIEHFTGMVDGKQYSGGKQVPRFRFVSETKPT
jgi:hypothetical protein